MPADLLKKRISIEQELNQVSYKGVRPGEIIGFLLIESTGFKIKEPSHNKKIFRQWLSVLTKLRFRKFMLIKTDVPYIHYSQHQKEWGILVEEQMMGVFFAFRLK